MKPVAWAFRHHVHAPVADVYAWMIDFREDDHSRPDFLRGAGIPESEWPKHQGRRQVVARDGDTIEIDDAWGRNRARLTVRLKPEEHTVDIEGEWGYAASWRAVQEGVLTRIEVQGGMSPSGISKLFLPLVRGKLLREMEKDFWGHMTDLEHAMRAARRREEPRQA